MTERAWFPASRQKKASGIQPAIASVLFPSVSRALALFAQLYDEPGTPACQARLPALHSQQLQSVLEKFAAAPKRLGDLQGEYYATVMWDETNAVKKDGTIRRETQFSC